MEFVVCVLYLSKCVQRREVKKAKVEKNTFRDKPEVENMGQDKIKIGNVKGVLEKCCW